MNKDAFFYIPFLRENIKKQSGIPMNRFSDSYLLSELLEHRGIILSAHTIARFFGILKERKVYPSTLKLFCNYLGFDNFQEFIEYTQLKHERSLLRSEASFPREDFVMVNFKMDLELFNSTELNRYLDALIFDSTEIEDLAHCVGSRIRRNKFQNELLELFAIHPNGRRLFYERFVDEDDPNGYFSNALSKYYIKHAKLENNTTFYYTYLIANHSYHNKLINQKWIDQFKSLKMDKEQLHFHEYSRIIEVKILLYQNEPKKIIHILDEAMEYCELLDNHAMSWILARCLKALSMVNQLEYVSYHPLKSRIIQLVPQLKIQSIGELIVQFFYYGYFNQNELMTPLAIDNRHIDNEFSTRLATETATTYLFSNEQTRKQIYSRLVNYCKLSGTNWILNALVHSPRF
jgi:hypothetical protein